MKRILQISAISLIAFGLIFGRYIGRYFVNLFDNPDTSINNGKLYAGKYISNCDTISLSIKSFKYSAQYFKAKGQFNASSDDNTAYIDKHQTLFYDNNHHKYFNILYFFNNNSDFDEVYSDYAYKGANSDGSEIIGVVNKNELSDPSYGTQRKPIPVLYFSSPDGHSGYYTFIEELNKPFKGNEAQFKTWLLNYNVGHYLSYVKSKADFEKMFGKEN